MATADNITRRICFACWINKATGTHSQYVTLTASHGNHDFADAPQSYAIRTSPVLFLHIFVNASNI
jgi:hypothetical protein